MKKSQKSFIMLVIILAIVNIILILMDYEIRGIISWASMAIILLVAFTLNMRRFIHNDLTKIKWPVNSKHGPSCTSNSRFISQSGP